MEDTIKRADAIKVIEETPFIRRPMLPHYIKAKINKIPSAEKQGEWLHVEGQLGLACSECGKMCSEITLCEDMVTKANWNYCPHCGARMRGDKR